MATKQQMWENAAMLFGTARTESTTPSTVADLKIWIPTQQYKICPSVVDTSPNFFFLFIKVYLLWYFPKLNLHIQTLA